MDVEPASALVALMFILLLIAFVAAAEVALASTSRSRMGQLIEQGVRRAVVVNKLLSEPAQSLTALTLLKSAGYFIGGSISLWLLSHSNWQMLSQILLMVGLWLGLIIVQIVSRAYTLRNPESVALQLSDALQISIAIMTPVTAALYWLAGMMRGQTEAATSERILLSEDELRFLLNMSEHEDRIDDEEKQMIASIFELSETVVREIMVPRLDVIAIDVESSVATALDLIVKKGHSRIPVYEENIDHIIGFLYAKDLLRHLRDHPATGSIRSILRKAFFVPQSKKLDELFQDMQMRHVHAAIVVDEYGGTAGLVTIEDLLEEIVGEIQDEYDTEEPSLQQLGPTTFLFNARIDLEKVSEVIGVDLTQENENVDTLGGFVYNQLGHVPEQGESLEYASRRFTVIAIDSRRIEQVRIEWTPEPIEPETLPLALNGSLASMEERRGTLGQFFRSVSSSS